MMAPLPNAYKQCKHCLYTKGLPFRRGHSIPKPSSKFGHSLRWDWCHSPVGYDTEPRRLQPLPPSPHVYTYIQTNIHTRKDAAFIPLRMHTFDNYPHLVTATRMLHLKGDEKLGLGWRHTHATITSPLGEMKVVYNPCFPLWASKIIAWRQPSKIY